MATQRQTRQGMRVCRHPLEDVATVAALVREYPDATPAERLQILQRYRPDICARYGFQCGPALNVHILAQRGDRAKRCCEERACSDLIPGAVARLRAWREAQELFE